jgi:Tfp pilus assembly protein PilX
MLLKEGIMNITNNKGFILVVTTLVLVALTAIGIAAIIATNTELTVTSSMKKAEQAYWAAEAGLQQGLGWLRDEVLRDTVDYTGTYGFQFSSTNLGALQSRQGVSPWPDIFYQSRIVTSESIQGFSGFIAEAGNLAPQTGEGSQSQSLYLTRELDIISSGFIADPTGLTRIQDQATRQLRVRYRFRTRIN